MSYEKEKISIVIPCKDEHEGVMKLVNQLQFQDIINQIIIVDSSDQPLQLKEPKVKIIAASSSNGPSVGLARDIGYRYSSSSVILFLDADCTLPDGFMQGVEQGIRMLNGSIGCVGGPVESEVNASMLQRYYDHSLFSPFPRYYGTYIHGWSDMYKHHHPSTSNLLVKKELLERVGGFHGGYGEDLDFMLRMAKQGFLIAYIATLKVHHNHRNTFRSIVRNFIRLGAYYPRTLIDFPSSPVLIHRIARLAFGFAPAFILIFTYPTMTIPSLLTPFLGYYLLRVKNVKAALLYTTLDCVLQLLVVPAGVLLGILKRGRLVEKKVKKRSQS